MVKEKKKIAPQKTSLFFTIILFLMGAFIGLGVLIAAAAFQFEKESQGKIYPGVRIDGISFSGKTKEEVEKYFFQKSIPFSELKITFTFEDKIATLSGKELGIAYDGKLSSLQAFLMGRSGHFLSDTYQKWRAATVGINLSTILKLNDELLEETVNSLASQIDISPKDALFQFEKGKVTLFRPAKEGQRLDKKKTNQLLFSHLNFLAREEKSFFPELIIDLPVERLRPRVRTEDSNNFGIRELIGVGNSKFVGSIPARVHNIELAASRINGHLVPPGAIFSFNETLGDVSLATGFQPAYIIKEGRTVLGDGGGVCQVSTTLFRAALNTGLPIEERHAHSYRVSYYEQDSPPGLDATVFAPSYDLKFKNDTQNYILIQAKTDKENYTLTFELYGAGDGRKVEITKPIILSQTLPPPDLYQDDPTLPKGVVKQVDWKAWGAKVNFDYKVTKETKIINQQSFFSHFQPWQAVFLRGTRE